jgi:NAD(P)-dependent dehydrogenase (short-subunit alcohol dehydrogenase family)
VQNKSVVITGGARGMGREAALALAEMDAGKIILVDWEGEEGTRTRDACNARAGRDVAEFVYCDLSSMAEVEALADDLNRRLEKLDVLINNAGITDPVRRLSADGYEMHLATCHLAHFILSNRLLNLLRASGAGRIVCISSDAHKAGPGLDFEDINNEAIWKGKPVSNNAAFQAYHRAKLSNLYMMQELDRRLAEEPITVNAVSPGYFINTTIHRQMTGIFKFGAMLVFGVGTLFGLNTPKKGARTHIWLASSPEVEGVSGKYFEHCREKAMSELAGDKTLQGRLWDWSERVTGVGFPD